MNPRLMQAARRAGLLRLLVFVVLGAAPLGAAAADANLLVTSGVVSVTRTGADGRPTELTLTGGDELRAGDLVVTARDGRAQIRFSDGSIVSLQPGTRFRIDEYHFDGDRQRGFFSLLRGALRTATGLIGKKDRDDYRMQTPTATIGIRGTDYSAEETVCDPACEPGPSAGLRVAVHEGRIVVANPAGSLEVARGQAAEASSQTSAPQLVNSPPVLSPTRFVPRAPGGGGSAPASADSTDSSASSGSAGSSAPAAPAATTSAASLANAAEVSSAGSRGAGSTATVALNKGEVNPNARGLDSQSGSTSTSGANGNEGPGPDGASGGSGTNNTAVAGGPADATGTGGAGTANGTGGATNTAGNPVTGSVAGIDRNVVSGGSSTGGPSGAGAATGANSNGGGSPSAGGQTPSGDDLSGGDFAAGAAGSTLASNPNGAAAGSNLPFWTLWPQVAQASSPSGTSQSPAGSQSSPGSQQVTTAIKTSAGGPGGPSAGGSGSGSVSTTGSQSVASFNAPPDTGADSISPNNIRQDNGLLLALATSTAAPGTGGSGATGNTGSGSTGSGGAGSGSPDSGSGTGSTGSGNTGSGSTGSGSTGSGSTGSGSTGSGSSGSGGSGTSDGSTGSSGSGGSGSGSTGSGSTGSGSTGSGSTGSGSTGSGSTGSSGSGSGSTGSGNSGSGGNGSGSTGSGGTGSGGTGSGGSGSGGTGTGAGLQPGLVSTVSLSVSARGLPIIQATQFNTSGTGGMVELDSQFRMQSIGLCPSLSCLSRGTAEFADTGHDAYVSWGRWTDGTARLNLIGFGNNIRLSESQGIHYLVGVPTVTLPTSGMFSYDLIGSTRPTISDGSVHPGTLTASAVVQFGTGTTTRVALNGTVAIANTLFPFTTNGGLANPGSSQLTLTGASSFGGVLLTHPTNAQAHGSSALNCGGAGCNVNVHGGFFGPEAARLGIDYAIQERTGDRTISGVGVFTKR